jgi:hypothetical protein
MTKLAKSKALLFGALLAILALPALAWPGGNGGGKGGGGSDPPPDLPAYTIEFINVDPGIGVISGKFGPGWNAGDGWGFNNYAEFVSTSDDGIPVLYTAETGFVPINSQIDPGSGWVVQRASDLNDSREIVGYADRDTDGDGTIDVRNIPVCLYVPPIIGEAFWIVEPLLDPAEDIRGEATSINNDGDIAGRIFYLSVSNYALALWDGNSQLSITTDYPGYFLNFVTDISERDASGDVYVTIVTVHSSEIGSFSRGHRYSTKTNSYVEMENNSTGAGTHAYAVNEFGDFAGEITTGGKRAWQWYQSALLYLEGIGQADLGTLATKSEDQTSHAFDVNGDVEVVGTAYVDGQMTGFVYHPTFGMQDLRNLVTNLPAGFSAGLPVYLINEDGQIWGISGNRMYILTPVP